MKKIMKATSFFATAAIAVGVVGIGDQPAIAGEEEHSVARQWNEALLDAIRVDLARPTVHARNLYHTSVAMWDAWAAYSDVADQVIHQEKLDTDNILAARNEAISYAAYRLLSHRFINSPGAKEAQASFDAHMDALGYDKNFTSTVGDSPAALGNRIAETIIEFGHNDNANEQNNYANLFYEPINPPLLPALPGNPDIKDPNRWQPLALDFFIDQSGNIILEGYPNALSPEWGNVTPFALSEDDLTIYERDGFDYWVYHDPGPPPYIGESEEQDEAYRTSFEMVSIWSSHLDPADGVMIDISPASIGNAELPEDPDEFLDVYNYFEGGDWGDGWSVNPVTGEPYEPQIVPRGDYTRILAEFWADGPDSETPPGHWFTILNYVNDHPLFEKRWAGEGPLLDDLEWDVKAYMALGGTMHDSAVAAWGVKGWYDYLRPVSALRYMADQGQSSDPRLPSYDPNGISLMDGYIELIMEEDVEPGGKFEHLVEQATNDAGEPLFDDRGNPIFDYHIGDIAILAWRGPDYIDDPEVDIAGVDWILAEDWWPYQRPSFVTPPFPGYVSGHSTFSRAAAELMTEITGSQFFPGGLGEFFCAEDEFLVFEDGPSMDVTLQWASYRDASDQTSLSRIWGGIHPIVDDLPGRLMGLEIAPDAVERAELYFRGGISCFADLTEDNAVNGADLGMFLGAWGSSDPAADYNSDGTVNADDFTIFMQTWGDCLQD